MNVPIACPCPPKGDKARHPEGDTVVLRDTLGYTAAMTVRNTVRLLRLEGANVAQALAGITECYLLVGIESWTVQDDKGELVPVNNLTIHEHLLSHLDQAMTVSDAADELYQASVMSPLVERDYGSTPPTPTPSEDEASSTSPSSSTTPEPSPLKPSKRSSISTSRTVAIETTSQSLGGVSNSSQSSQSAA